MLIHPEPTRSLLGPLQRWDTGAGNERPESEWLLHQLTAAHHAAAAARSWKGQSLLSVLGMLRQRSKVRFRLGVIDLDSIDRQPFEPHEKEVRFFDTSHDEKSRPNRTTQNTKNIHDNAK